MNKQQQNFKIGLQPSVTAAGIIEALPKTEVYLVGGPSGAGKTAFARAFSETRPVVLVPLDDYFVDEEMVRFSVSSRYGRARQWDHPSSVDLPLALQNVNELLNENRTQLPIFSFSENRRIGYRTFTRSSKAAVLVEGLHALLLSVGLHGEGRSVHSTFIDASVRVRRDRISVRDAKNRDRPLSDFDRRFYFMRIAEDRWILPQRRRANLVLDTSDDSFLIVATKHK